MLKAFEQYTRYWKTSLCEAHSSSRQNLNEKTKDQERNWRKANIDVDYEMFLYKTIEMIFEPSGSLQIPTSVLSG